MTAQQLKNSILQMAVQGKLVPQNPDDEPASVLLERIKTEKEELIKAGKIKKDKKSSEIFRGASRNFAYAFCEQSGKEIRDISDEIPFDIPDSWEWVRFSNLVHFSIGKTPPRKDDTYWNNAKFPWVSIADLINDGIVTTTKEMINQYSADNTFKGKISPAGTLLMSFKLTVGKVSILEIDAYHNEAIISIYPFVDNDKIITSFLFKIMPLISQSGNTKTAIKGATLNSDSLNELLIPLPPISEQKRIVAKIEELLPYIEAYEKAETQLTALNTSFPEMLKKSILQEAVQGKLVPQNPDDEPASVLLERIRAEKQELIKQGKIKKNKNESVIITRDKIHYEILNGNERCIADEIPFDIPESWCWCKWGNISESIQYGYNAPAKENGRIKMVRISDIQENCVSWNTVPYCDIDEKDIQIYLLAPNDILFARTGGTVGKSYLVKSVPEEAVYAGYLIRTRYSKSLCPEYLKFFMESELYWSQLRNGTIATAQPNCNGKTLANIMIPIPPLSEQKRIVDKINELMPIINSISK